MRQGRIKKKLSSLKFFKCLKVDENCEVFIFSGPCWDNLESCTD